MAPRLTPQQTADLEGLLRLNLTTSDIRQRTGISKSYVNRMRMRLHTFGAITNPRLNTMGRPLELTPEIDAFVVALYTASPDLYQEEIQYHILQQYDVLLSISTISRHIRSAEFTRKVL